MTELTLTPTTSLYSIGDDFLANKANELISFLRKLDIHFEVWRHTKNEIVFCDAERVRMMRLCEDDITPNEAYLVDAWVLFDADICDNDDLFNNVYEGLQQLNIVDDWNTDFSGEDY
jgi:hypothetical protein